MIVFLRISLIKGLGSENESRESSVRRMCILITCNFIQKWEWINCFGMQGPEIQTARVCVHYLLFGRGGGGFFILSSLYLPLSPSFPSLSSPLSPSSSGRDLQRKREVLINCYWISKQSFFPLLPPPPHPLKKNERNSNDFSITPHCLVGKQINFFSQGKKYEMWTDRVLKDKGFFTNSCLDGRYTPVDFFLRFS